MRKSIFFSLLSILVVLTSCNFTEDLYIDENGGGRIAIKFDGSELMKMGGEEFNNNEKDLDSVISFKELLAEKKDSISKLPLAEQERLKKLENFNMRMLIDSEAGEMEMNLYTDFKELSELSDVFSAFQNAGTLTSKGETPNSPISAGTDATEVSYSMESGVFKRIGKVKSEELLQQNVDSLGSMEMFLSSSTYTLNYHFPRKIKSVSVKGALFSEDRKSLTYKVPFMDYMKDPESLNIEVVLEDK